MKSLYFHVCSIYLLEVFVPCGQLPRCAARFDCEHPRYMLSDPRTPITGSDRRWTSLESTRNSCGREIERESCLKFRPEIEVTIAALLR